MNKNPLEMKLEVNYESCSVGQTIVWPTGLVSEIRFRIGIKEQAISGIPI